jgi:hypothetical protein
VTGINILAGRLAKYGRNKNHQQRLRIAERLDTRARLYLGDQYNNLGNYFTGRENRRLNHLDPELGSFAGFIPPINIAHDAPMALARAFRLRRDFPYNTGDTPQVEPVEDPSIHEFLTKVLGYSEKEVRKKIGAENYQIAKGHIHEKMRVELDRVHSGDILDGFYPETLDKAISKLKEPRDEAEWTAKFNNLIASQYSNYLKSRAKEEKSLRKDLDKGSVVITPEMSKQEYQARINNILRYKQALWALQSQWNYYIK